MKNSISKYMMIAAAAVALFAAMESKAAPAGTTSPTPVLEQAVPAKTAVNVSFNCTTDGFCSTNFAVPAGMRLVIESYTGAFITSLNVPITIMFSTTLDGVQNSGEYWAPDSMTPILGGTKFMSSYRGTTKIYTDSVNPIGAGGGLANERFFPLPRLPGEEVRCLD